jgi:hypothetical protein
VGWGGGQREGGGCGGSRSLLPRERREEREGGVVMTWRRGAHSQLENGGDRWPLLRRLTAAGRPHTPVLLFSVSSRVVVSTTYFLFFFDNRKMPRTLLFTIGKRLEKYFVVFS